MKKVILISLLVLSLVSINSFASDDKKNIYSIIEVITPAKEVYDDGIYRKLFGAFYITDENGNKVLSSGEVFDKAAQVKLPEGTYRIHYYGLDGRLFEKNLKVSEEYFLIIELR
ncbi:MAG: hypothetical protein ACPL25_11980 [Ignavibacteria bacterium]